MKHSDVSIPKIQRDEILIRSILILLNMLIKRKQYDSYFIGFYSQIIGLGISCLRYRPIILDAYLSTFETLCEDRKLFDSKSLFGKLAYWLDKESFTRADLLITDTQANKRYFSNVFNIPENKIEVIYVGCDEEIFYPRNENLSESTVVFYYGSFLPLHGTDIILEAVEQLKFENKVRFVIGGCGPTYPSFVRKVKEKSLNNVTFTGWIPIENIPYYISSSTICLGGHFSNIPKAKRVIPTKAYQFIAMRKPTIVGDNEAIRELFTPFEHVYPVVMGNGYALAEAIRCLSKNSSLREHIAEKGYKLFLDKLTVTAISVKLQEILNRI